MQPNVIKEQRNGWLALACAFILSSVCVGWYSLDSDLTDRLAGAKEQYRKLHGPEPMLVHIARQKLANANLLDTIEDLKKGTGFPDATFFTITAADRASGEHDASIFLKKFYQVQDECEQQAKNFSLKNWSESSLGFPESGKMPSDAEVPYLMTMLQLTRRAARICFSTPPLSRNTDPIKDIQFTHGLKPEKPTGPDGRPPLLTEYPLTIKFTASLTETMWILWRFSVGQVDDSSQPADPTERIEDDLDPNPYPFLLESFSVTSPVIEETDADDLAHSFISVTMRVGPVKFVSQQTRANLPATPGQAQPRPAAVPVPQQGEATPGNASTGARP